ncbi:MAG: O-antigen ligase family protein [Candidatus Korobacteraceae bacterium]
MLIYFFVIIGMPFMRHQFWNAEFGPGLTTTKLSGAICLIYALVYLARRHGIPRYLVAPQAVLMILFFGFAGFSWVSTGWQATTIDLVNPIYMYFSTLVFFFITMTVIDSVKRLYWSCMVAVGSVGFASVYMLREWQRGTETFGEGYRPGWVVGDANYFTIAALAVMPIAFELTLVASSKLEKVYAVACTLLTFAAVTLGASRGGFLGIVLMVFYLIARSRKPARNLAMVIVVTIPFMIFAPNSPINRFFHPAGGDKESVNKHLVGWEAGLNMIKKHPITGIGFGNYKAVVTRYDKSGEVRLDPHVAHNAHLEVAAELGLPALVVFWAFLGTAFYSAGKTRKRALARGAETLAAIAVGCQASILGTSVGIFFVSGQYTRLFWFVMCMTMVMPLLVPARAPAKNQPLEMPRPPAETEESFRVGEALVALH